MQTITKVPLRGSTSRTPPVPPPKPNVYHLHYPNVHIAKLGQFPRTSTGGQLPPPPGDSDTDSGICADSDNQFSPRHLNGLVFIDDKSKLLQRNFEIPIYREHLTPESVWRLHRNSSTLACQRRLPQQPQTSFANNNQTQKSTKQYRVSTTDFDSSSSASGWTNNTLGSDTGNSDANYSGYCTHRSNTGSKSAAQVMTVTDSNTGLLKTDSSAKPANSDRDFISVQQQTVDDIFNQDYNGHQQPKVVNSSYSAENFTSAPPIQTPPTYSVTMMRLRRNDDQRIPHSNPESRTRVIRRFHNRSASLPRGMHRHSIASELRRGSTDCCYMQQNHTPFKDGKEPILDANLMRSVDNLYLSKPNHSSHHNGMRFTAGRRLPNLPINNAILDGNSRRMHKLVTENRSQSVGRVPRLSDSSLTNCSLDLSYRPSSFQVQSPVVRAQLIALDHRGLRTVLIEKLQPGPFGFYIATGVYNQKRGIYISRVSLPSLTPILSVGDEIIYVENELVKGEDLEYVQALIAGKNCVKIVVLPTVATPSC